VPSISTSAITIYKGNEFKEWNGHALITSLKDKSLRKLIFKNKSSIKEEVIFKDEIGRIRDIQVNPNNGKIYFLAGDSLWLMEKN
jgi:quinoprotein glucose dehydrogenase